MGKRQRRRDRKAGLRKDPNKPLPTTIITTLDEIKKETAERRDSA